MNFELKYWKCQTLGCYNMLDDQLQRCSYPRKYCEQCRKEKYLEYRRKRVGLRKEVRLEA